jgi:hypothetical protein
MVTFGLITEGITDQIVIENILVGYFDNPDILVRHLLPIRDITSSHSAENHSDWYQVFEYCKSENFKGALQYNDYIIVQIDTDVSDEIGFDVPKKEAGRGLSAEELIERVVNKFKLLIGEEFYEDYKQRIIFAISVDAIECWLLPLYYTNNKARKITGCLRTLNQELSSKEEFTIDPNHKNPEYYEYISRRYCRKRTLMDLYKKNPSLKVFIEEIISRKIALDLPL